MDAKEKQRRKLAKPSPSIEELKLEDNVEETPAVASAAAKAPAKKVTSTPKK